MAKFDEANVIRQLRRLRGVEPEARAACQLQERLRAGILGQTQRRSRGRRWRLAVGVGAGAALAAMIAIVVLVRPSPEPVGPAMAEVGQEELEALDRQIAREEMAARWVVVAELASQAPSGEQDAKRLAQHVRTQYAGTKAAQKLARQRL